MNKVLQYLILQESSNEQIKNSVGKTFKEILNNLGTNTETFPNTFIKRNKYDEKYLGELLLCEIVIH